ncbi:hypothetical protein Tco_1296271 [Tanacetum coccineum]
MAEVQKVRVTSTYQLENWILCFHVMEESGGANSSGVMVVCIRLKEAATHSNTEGYRRVASLAEGPLTSKLITRVNHLGGGDDNSNETPNFQEHILRHMSSLQSLIKQQYDKSGPVITPLRLAFGDDTDVKREMEIARNMEVLKDGDL